ncbi:hypothetical protein ACQP00_46415 [Dactylosporangium sp. CS-047395]|uniref:hypothetical protein n=1 Tax=Dactylosporangium sp. CS-047395 TaxID=3239936 RepID=UPI003D8FA353
MPDNLLHRLLHRIPGVPEHRENRQHATRAHAHGHASRTHTHDRPPRILAGWQRRIAGLFGQR